MPGGNYHTLLPRHSCYIKTSSVQSVNVVELPWTGAGLGIFLQDLGMQWPYCHWATFSISIFKFVVNNISKIIQTCGESLWNLIIWMTPVCGTVCGFSVVSFSPVYQCNVVCDLRTYQCPDPVALSRRWTGSSGQSWEQRWRDLHIFPAWSCLCGEI